MNILDKLASLISPKWGAQRAAWRQIEKRAAGYDVANSRDPRNRHWMWDNSPAETTLARERDIIRGRARDLERNSSIVNACIYAIQRNVIGLGFQLQAQTNSDRLNDEIEKLWAEWCKPRNCDVAGSMGLTAMLETALRRKIVDGGVLLLKRYTRGGPCPFSLQMVEVDALSSPLQPHKQGNNVISGVEVDKYMLPRGYWIQPYSPDSLTCLDPTFVKAANAFFISRRTGRRRFGEVSELAPVLDAIRQVNEWIAADVEKQRILAYFAAIVTRQADGQFGRGAFVDDDKAKKSLTEGLSELFPGMVMDANVGEGVDTVNPTGQAADAATFLKTMVGLIASGLGTSYVSVSRDPTGMNYSTMRQAAIEDEVAYAAGVQEMLDLLQEIYETFVISCVVSGTLNIPPQKFFEAKENYLAHRWIRIPKRWVDPKKEAEANILLMQNGLKTFAQTVAESGGDWKDALDSVAEAVKYGDRIGIDVRRLVYDGKLGTEQSDAGQSSSDELEPGADESGGDNEPERNDADKPDAGTESGVDEGTASEEPTGDETAD